MRIAGVVEEIPEQGLIKIVKPVGMVETLIPTTGPDATPPLKTLLALKGRNAIGRHEGSVSTMLVCASSHLICLRNSSISNRFGTLPTRERAAREREERIRKALLLLPEMEAKKAEAKEKARVSTTEVEATVMKMADGGFRPAYNVQFSTDTASQVIVGVEVATCGSDPGQRAPMVEPIHERYEQYPHDVLVDGGFVKHEDIDTVSAPEKDCTVYGPVPRPKEASKDRCAPHAMDSAAVAA